MTFSVIMPVYNHQRYLAEAVRSVRRQSYSRWELIIIDDGSTDGSGRLADALAAEDGRIIAIHCSNAGPAAARNAGIRRAGGQWLAYLDSDDVWFPDALQSYADCIASHPEARFIYGCRHRLNEDGSITRLPAAFQDRLTGAGEVFQRMYLSHLCVCYRRELIREAGPYDENLRSCEDYELYLRMSLRTAFQPIAKATGLRRRHGTNISRRSGFSRMLEAEVLRRFIEQQGGRELVEPRAVERRLSRLYCSAAVQYFKARCYEQAVSACRLAGGYRRSFKAAMVQAAAILLRPFGTTDGRGTPRLDRDVPAPPRR